MPQPRLKALGKRMIREASQEAVSGFFDAFPPHERRRKWIRLGNKYRVNCIQRYRDDLAAGNVDDPQLVAYIAASSPAHVIDGWSFLGRAIDCTLRRDAYSAVHFGYYAELRAAMGLLASEGIGVLDRKHPVIDTAGKTNPLPKMQFWDRGRSAFRTNDAGTHGVVGPCLRQWATLSRSEQLLDSLVQPDGVAISDWLAACRSQARPRAVAQGWLRAWGLDLNSIDEDRDARNLASYRPSEFRPSRPLPVQDVVRFVGELWRMFEPSVGGKFPAIERHLLRRALRSGRSSSPTAGTLMQLGLSSAETQGWVAFLPGQDDPTPFEHAERTSKIDASECHLQVISRAALLLYVATSAAGRLLRSAGYSLEDLEFWWRGFGDARGFWDMEAELDSPRDTWADIEASLQDSETWLSQTSADDQSLWRFRSSAPGILNHLGAWDIVGVWGLVP